MCSFAGVNVFVNGVTVETKSIGMHAQGPVCELKKIVNACDSFNFNYPRVIGALRNVYTAVLKTKSL